MAAPSTKRSLEEEAITESADDDADLDSIDPEEVNDDVELTSDDTPEEDEKEDEDNDRTVDFGEAFGSSNEGSGQCSKNSFASFMTLVVSGWKVTNTDVVEGTDCFTIGSNAWELAGKRFIYERAFHTFEGRDSDVELFSQFLLRLSTRQTSLCLLLLILLAKGNSLLWFDSKGKKTNALLLSALC